MSSRKVNRRQCRHDPECSSSISPPPSTTTSTTTDSFDSTSTTSAITFSIATSTSTSTPPSVVAASSPTSTSARSNTLAASSKSNAGTIAGSVIGSVIFLVLVVLGTLLYLRARKRKRTPPSSEFMNSIRAGATPVLRLDSGAEYTHYPPFVPPPFTQNTYYSSPPMLDMKLPDEMIESPSGRPSVERPLHPQRYSSQRHASDPFVAQHHPSASVGSQRELWGSDTEMVSGELSPVRQSPAHTDSVLQFAPRFSLGDSSPLSPLPSHSPPPLHPLRRQPDAEDS